MKPFTKKAVTANNEELNIDSEKNCIIKLGNEVSRTNVFISPEVKDEFLMGIDYLETCELTKPHIVGLRKAIEDASYQLYKELDLKENILLFQEVDDIKSVLIHEHKLEFFDEDKMDGDYVLVPLSDEIYKFLNSDIKNSIRTVKDAYPLPNIENMLRSLSNARIFTKLDLTHGYWQI